MSIIRVIPSFPGGKLKAFTMSYDDGVIEDEKLISLMEKNRCKGTFNLNSGKFCNGMGEDEIEQVDTEEFRKRYQKDCCEVATHMVTHPMPNELTDVLAVKEIVKDRDNIEKFFGKIVTGHAYPCGQFNEGIVKILKQVGIKYARGIEITHGFELPDDLYNWKGTCRNLDEELFNLLDEFLSGAPNTTQNPWLFYLWGHAYEFGTVDSWERIEEFLTKIGNRDDIWYATNGEIVDYLEAFNSLEYSADGHRIFNPSALDVSVRVTVRANKGFYDLALSVPSGETVNVVISEEMRV